MATEAELEDRRCAAREALARYVGDLEAQLTAEEDLVIPLLLELAPEDFAALRNAAPGCAASDGSLLGSRQKGTM